MRAAEAILVDELPTQLVQPPPAMTWRQLYPSLLQSTPTLGEIPDALTTMLHTCLNPRPLGSSRS